MTIESGWFKSTYSVGDTNCLEVRWTKSSYSQKGASNCLECRTDHGHVLIRDTQNRHLGQLEVPAQEWRAFLAEVERL